MSKSRGRLAEPALRPSTAAERDDRAQANAGEPTLEFSGRVPYDEYVHASTLHQLQTTVSDDPGEMSFLMISQIMELYFGLICHEMRQAQHLLRADDAWHSLAPLQRCARHLEGLNASWQGLSWMTPADFNRFRNQLGEGSGFQSAMYRQLEFLLGLRTASLVRAFRGDPAVYQDLVAALHSPGLYDDVLAMLARRGLPIPAGRMQRDFSVDLEPDAQVEQVWCTIYHDDRPDNELRILGEALTDIAQRFQDWRYRHLTAVRRTMGAKAGSGGSAGLTWLQRSMDRTVFPELWSARTVM
jgi:tryptophan 2,3-dioxygenase